MITLVFLTLGLADAATIIGGVVALLAAVTSVLIAWIRNRGAAGALAEKDAIIRTREQTIDAFEDRINQLETDLKRVVETAKDAEETIRKLHDRIKSLQLYTAPEAVDRFSAQVDALAKKRELEYEDIIGRLGRIETTLTKNA